MTVYEVCGREVFLTGHERFFAQDSCGVSCAAGFRGAGAQFSCQAPRETIRPMTTCFAGGLVAPVHQPYNGPPP